MKRMKSTINYDQWDIILVRFSFTDFQSAKHRPALIVSPQDYNLGPDLIIVFITSKLDRVKRPGDYLIHNWKKARLPKPSMIRMKFATIDKSIIVKRLGKLTPADIQAFQKNLINFFS
jgi:mRNA interferase MazF